MPNLVLIGLQEATVALKAGVAFARQRGLAISLVVVDTAGHLVAASRMDGAAFATTEVARGKAFACVATGGHAGGVLARRYRDNPMLWSLTGPLGYGAPMLPATGALPVRREHALLGAIGASGAAPELDEGAVAPAVDAIAGASSERSAAPLREGARP